MKFTVRVPATSANLGPGFDCLGLALALYNEVTVQTEAEPGATWEGEGEAELPTDGSDLTSRVMARVAGELGVELPPFALHGHNAVPLERGLGSSSAATVAGVLLAAALADHELSSTDALALATQIEGHPDNATPCVLGGFTIAGERSVRLDPAAGLSPVALVPTRERLSTAQARAALPDRVTLTDAAFNVAHAALAVVAFTTDPELLGQALGDRLHQDTRLALVPTVRDAFDRLRADGVPVCVSGSGPTLLAFPAPGERLDLGSDWRVLPLNVDTAGAVVLPVP